MAPSLSTKNRVWSRREIEGLIASGRNIIILNGLVVRADAWIPYHPGGDKAILHLVGRDGTDEITAFHSEDTQARMHKFVIGRVQGKWENFLPPIQGGKFRHSHVDNDEQAPHATDSVSSRGRLTLPSSAPNTEKTAKQLLDGCAGK